jgi:hypothetical protein
MYPPQGGCHGSLPSCADYPRPRQAVQQATVPVRPNPQMQPTGRAGPPLRSGAPLLVAKQWKRTFGLQLICISLGRCTKPFSPWS